jgi:hypothetical protein
MVVLAGHIRGDGWAGCMKPTVEIFSFLLQLGCTLASGCLPCSNLVGTSIDCAGASNRVLPDSESHDQNRTLASRCPGDLHFFSVATATPARRACKGDDKQGNERLS